MLKIHCCYYLTCTEITLNSTNIKLSSSHASNFSPGLSRRKSHVTSKNILLAASEAYLDHSREKRTQLSVQQTFKGYPACSEFLSGSGRKRKECNFPRMHFEDPASFHPMNLLAKPPFLATNKHDQYIAFAIATVLLQPQYRYRPHCFSFLEK